MPDDVHIAGDNVSYREVRGIVCRVREELGVQTGEIKLQVLDLAEFRDNLKREHLAQLKTGSESISSECSHTRMALIRAC